MSRQTPRVVLLGATGYTGHLTAIAMARRGMRPVLVGRSRDKLDTVLADVLANGGIAGGLEVADVGDPSSIAAVVRADDVLVTTVGPFSALGEPAVRAAIDNGARAYIDSTGEPPFIRRIFEEWGPQAESAGTSLLTAFGYDYVPGNLAAAIVAGDLATAGKSPVRIDIGYFIDGRMAVSGGTAASAAGAITMPQFRYSGATLMPARGGQSWRTFTIDGRDWDGLSIGGTEHFTVPRLAPTITEVNDYLGWAGKTTRTISRLSRGTSLLTRIPGSDRVVGALAARGAPSPGDGPPADVRAQSRTLAVAEAFDGVGRLLGTAVVRGPSPYDLTAELLAWGADQAAEGQLAASGALGPADAFGGPGALSAQRAQALIDGCASLGLARA